VCTQACLHANDAWRQPFEGLDECQSFYLATESNSTVSTETDDVEHFLPDADRGQGDMVVSIGSISGCCGVVLADYSRRGGSRSIPLADIDQSGDFCGLL
jgi:hypothetical protein